MMTSIAPQDDAARTGSTPGPRSAMVSTWPSAPTSESGDKPFTLRWGRIAVALGGLLALCAALVTLVLAVVGVVPLLVPLICVGLAAVAVAVLRVLAVRSRRARVDRAFADAMAPVREVAPDSVEAAPVAPPVPERPTILFDVEESAKPSPTAMELRTAALAAAGSSRVHSRDASASGPVADTAEPAGATAWAPVEVPRPMYVDAAKAERQAPAPLDLPEAPKPSSRTPIKASEAAARAAATAADDGATDVPVTADPATGRINLDDVLQRRRA